MDLQLHFQLYLTNMDLEEEKPTGKLCTPTKLSGCENDIICKQNTASTTHTKLNSNKTSLEKKAQTLKMPREYCTFNFIPKFTEMVQFRKTCWMFSSLKEFLKKAESCNFKPW